MPIYTAQYRYSGADRIDITAKTSDKLIRETISPSWDMVKSFKEGFLSEKEYAERYKNQLNLAWFENNESKTLINRWIKLSQKKDLTFVCFCPSFSFCHRFLFISWMVSHFPVKYIKERESSFSFHL